MATNSEIVDAVNAALAAVAPVPFFQTSTGDQATPGLLAGLAVDLPALVASVVDAINAGSAAIVAAIEGLPHHGH